MMQFFGKNLTDRFASKNNMNFSLSLSTVGDFPNGFFLSFVSQVLLQNLCSWQTFP